MKKSLAGHSRRNNKRKEKKTQEELNEILDQTEKEPE